MNIRVFLLVCTSIITWTVSCPVDALERPPLPDKYGIGIVLGHTVDPVDDIDYLMFSGFGLWPYDRFWQHPAPENLYFKIEMSTGVATTGTGRLTTSINIFAVQYMDFLHLTSISPFLEAGIGGIYTDFQVEGQGLRFNFNPQAGIGIEMNSETSSKSHKTRSYFTRSYIIGRAHHISNGGLHDQNRGLNALTLVCGIFF